MTLQLLAGTRLLADATEGGVVVTSGDGELLARLSDYLPESAATSAS